MLPLLVDMAVCWNLASECSTSFSGTISDISAVAIVNRTDTKRTDFKGFKMVRLIDSIEFINFWWIDDGGKFFPLWAIHTPDGMKAFGVGVS